AHHSWEFSNANVSDGQLSGVVALQGNMSLLRASVFRPNTELARLDFGLPIRTPQLVLEELEAVQPMLDVRALGDDASGIPLANGLEVTVGRHVQLIRGTGQVIRPLVVGRFGVVEKLILRRRPVDVFLFFGSA